MTDAFSHPGDPVFPIRLQTLFPSGTFNDGEPSRNSAPLNPEELPQEDDGIEYVSEAAVDSRDSQGRFVLSDVAQIWGPLLQHTEPFRSTFDKHCEGRRIFLTKKGYLGLGPEGAQSGDIIILLKGSYVP